MLWMKLYQECKGLNLLLQTSRWSEYRFKSLHFSGDRLVGLLRVVSLLFFFFSLFNIREQNQEARRIILWFKVHWMLVRTKVLICIDRIFHEGSLCGQCCWECAVKARKLLRYGWLWAAQTTTSRLCLWRVKRSHKPSQSFTIFIASHLFYYPLLPLDEWNARWYNASTHSV